MSASVWALDFDKDGLQSELAQMIAALAKVSQLLFVETAQGRGERQHYGAMQSAARYMQRWFPELNFRVVASAATGNRSCT